MKGELPSDLTPDELNDMIAVLGREMGCPYDVFPDHVELGEDIPAHVRGFNRGCLRDGKPWDGVTIYREGQRWRRLIIEEVRQRPEWIRAWRAARELDRRIEELCQRKGLRFAPHETPPWWAPDEMPERAPGESPRTSAWDTTLPQAVKLRQQLKAEIEAEDAGNPPRYRAFDAHGAGRVRAERDHRSRSERQQHHLSRAAIVEYDHRCRDAVRADGRLDGERA